jgi:hypothetical protein
MLCRFWMTQTSTRSMAMRETTAISCNCCSCRSLTVGFEICELQHRLQGWAASCSWVIGRFCHIPPLPVSSRPKNRTRSSSGSGRPDPLLRPVDLRLAVRPSQRASTGRLSRHALRVSSTSPPRKNAMIKRGRVRATISSSPATNLRSCSFWAATLIPRVRGAVQWYARTQRERSLNSARDRIRLA